MAKITKRKGLTISNTRTRRAAAIVSAVVEPDGEVVAAGLEVPTGAAKAVVAWIGDDPERAAAAESDRRKDVRKAVERVLGDG